MAEIIMELLAFVLVIFVLYRWVRPLVQQMVRDRQDQIQQQVEASEEATRRLQDAERRFERAETEARKEVAKIRDDARADATHISEELREQANREVERIRQRGQEQLVAQRDLMVRGLRADLGRQSMRLAERIVTDVLTDDRRKTATVDGFLSDLEAMVPRTSRAKAAAGAAASGGASDEGGTR
jgi:F-type H+-transporting ATPase subunit b